MDSWSFDSKTNMGSMDWEAKSPFIFENNMVCSHDAISINQGFEDTCVPDQILGSFSLSPIMGGTHNKFLEEHAPSSELSGSSFKSSGLFDIIPHAPSKQKRISSPPLCKVHGCNKSLVSCKDYHKRHKVCELHSKTSKVIVNGIEQRFCQQCSRFHLLSEFDEGKRSCRKRLADHNERRRKPHSGHHERLLPPYNPKGSKFKGFTRTRGAKSSSMCNDDIGTMSSVTDVHQYPWIYGHNNGYLQPSNSVLFPHASECLTGGVDDFITMDSTCALSLLSSQSHGSSSVIYKEIPHHGHTH
ncbi:hypothetical protein LXL04_008718 [Taraxacum kok-saghyz]